MILTESLFAKRQLLEFTQSISLCSAIDDGVFEQITLHPINVDGTLGSSLFFSAGGLQLPGVPSLAMDKTWEVVALVEKLEHRAKDLGLLVRQGYPLRSRIHVPVPKGMGKVGTRR